MSVFADAFADRLTEDIRRLTRDIRLGLLRADPARYGATVQATVRRVDTFLRQNAMILRSLEAYEGAAQRELRAALAELMGQLELMLLGLDDEGGQRLLELVRRVGGWARTPANATDAFQSLAGNIEDACRTVLALRTQVGQPSDLPILDAYTPRPGGDPVFALAMLSAALVDLARLWLGRRRR